jgi:hypothetical protein
MTLDQLQDLFEEQRAKFPAARGCQLRLVRRHFVTHPTSRDLGWYEDGCIYLMEKILRAPRHRVLGIVRHELGHAADPDIGTPGAEQRADDIVLRCTGERINYDAGDIQTVAPGTYPRPLHLHR